MLHHLLASGNDGPQTNFNMNLFTFSFMENKFLFSLSISNSTWFWGIKFYFYSVFIWMAKIIQNHLFWTLFLNLFNFILFIPSICHWVFFIFRCFPSYIWLIHITYQLIHLWQFFSCEICYIHVCPHASSQIYHFHMTIKFKLAVRINPFPQTIQSPWSHRPLPLKNSPYCTFSFKWLFKASFRKWKNQLFSLHSQVDDSLPAGLIPSFLSSKGSSASSFLSVTWRLAVFLQLKATIWPPRWLE